MAKIRDVGRVRWNLKFAILAKYGSETEFARLIEISPQQLTHIIVGRNPGYHIRRRAVELLGYPEAYLFGPAPNPSAEIEKHKVE